MNNQCPFSELGEETLDIINSIDRFRGNETRAQAADKILIRDSRLYMAAHYILTEATTDMKIKSLRHVLGSLQLAEEVLQLHQVARDSDGQ